MRARLTEGKQKGMILHIKRNHSTSLYGWLFIGPWLIGFLAFLAYPLLYSFWMSFRELQSIGTMQTTWRGVANFVEAFVLDVRFVPILLTSLRNCIVDTPLTLVFSLGIAMLVERDIVGKDVFRWILFLPVVIGSGMVIERLFGLGVGWQTSVLATEGVAEWMVFALGPDVADAVFGLLQRISFVLWRSGVQILIFIAGLQGLPKGLYEAARCDGASEWVIFWKITLPMISPVLWLNAVYTIVEGFTDVFNPMLEYIRQTGFHGQLRMGYASALGWIYFVAIFSIVLLIMSASNRYSFYGGDR